MPVSYNLLLFRCRFLVSFLIFDFDFDLYVLSYFLSPIPFSFSSRPRPSYTHSFLSIMLHCPSDYAFTHAFSHSLLP